MMDLRNAQRLFYGSTEAQALHYGSQVLWTRPDEGGFPEALMTGPYAHYAAEDAGATWTARHGMPLVMDRIGTVGTAMIGGVPFLNTQGGCYEAIRDPWPAETPFTLWVLAEASTTGSRQFYNGPEVFSNSPVSFQFRLRDMEVSSGNGRRLSEVPSTGVNSYAWSRQGDDALSDVDVRFNAENVPTTSTAVRSTDASGPVFMVGGTRNSSAGRALAAVVVRDILLTVGWTLNAEQRAAMEAYKAARLTP